MVSLVGVSECFLLPLTENGCGQHPYLVVVSGCFAVSVSIVSEWVFCLVVVSGCFAVSVFVVSEWVFSLVVVAEYLLSLSQRVAVMGAFRMFCISFRAKWL